MNLEAKLKPFFIDIHGGDYIHPKHLKIDYFCDFYRRYIELGIYYLDGKINKNDVPYTLHNRLEKLSKIEDYEALPERRKIVHVYFKNQCLCIGDGRHRIIIHLFRRKIEERYEKSLDPYSKTELIQWGKKTFKDPDELINGD